MLEFFESVFGEAKGYVCVYTYPPSERNRNVPWKDWRLKAREWFQWPAQKSELVSYCNDRRKEDVYVSPALYAKPTRNTKDNVKALSVVHCDADDAHPALFAVPPSVIVQSSPGRYQLYWKLKKQCDPEAVEQAARRVYLSQKPNGADSGWQMNKLMRVPGTCNTKPEYGRRQKVTAQFFDRAYDLKKLARHFDRTISAEVTPQDRKPGRLDEYNVVSNKIPSSPELMRLMTEEPTGAWYKAMWRLAHLLFQAGLSAEDVYVVCLQAPCNKYVRDNRDAVAETWRDVLRVEASAAAGVNYVIVGEDVKGELQKVEVSYQGKANFLSKADRDLITPTFIDMFTAWGEKKTPLADPKYHRANAMTVLSTVFSDYGYAPANWGSFNLSMFFMVLGVTSRSKKTTAANLMLRVVKGMEHDRDFPYMLKQDNSPEAMVVSLAERNGTSTLFHKDEAQELVKQSANGNHYNRGFTAKLLKFYDGVVEARNRIGSINTEEVPATLTANLLGLPGEMTESLTEHDWNSGFLARFVFVLGTPRDSDPDSIRLPKPEIGRARDADPDYDDIITKLQVAKQFWHKRWLKGGSTQIGIPPTDDAWELWSRFQEHMHAIQVGPEGAEMGAIADRMNVTVQKLAALLAMAEKKLFVDRRHMATAIMHAEEWYDTAVVMHQLVQHSAWSRQVDDLVKMLLEQYPDGVTSDVVYSRKFKRMRAREFTELIEAAVKQGRITEESVSMGGKPKPFLRGVK